ncbi:MAG: type II toxin-antitoxin system Phd/YefM family antitoxin [Chloroflexota bacterium]
MKTLPVAELKRDFSHVLDAAERGQSTVVLRRGKPVAVVEPVSQATARGLPVPQRPGGLLAVAGLLADWETLDDDLAAVVAARRWATDRPTPNLD